MRITIEDLEALKELNDELEENHVETEKAMQEDLGTSVVFLSYLLSMSCIIHLYAFSFCCGGMFLL